MVPLSVLDLSPIVEGSAAADALRNTLDLARHAEQWGYRRYWLAEHHNMPGIASAATSIVIAHVPQGARPIRGGPRGPPLPLAVRKRLRRTGTRSALRALELYSQGIAWRGSMLRSEVRALR